MGTFLNSVRGIYKASGELASKVDEGHGYNSPQVYEKVSELHEKVSNLLDFLEENDENMTIGKLDSVDEHFEGNPVSDYVGAVTNLLTGDGTLEEAREALSRLEVGKQETVEEFSERIVDSLVFTESEEGYKNTFQNSLGKAIEAIKSRGGRAQFVVDVNGEFLGGAIYNTGNSIEVFINDEEFELVYGDEHKDEEDECTGDYETCSNPDCCMEDYEDEEDDAESDALDRLDWLYGFVGDIDEEYYNKVNEVMEDIKDALSQVEHYSSKDLDLMRYYLKNLPYNNEDVESLSDRAIILAFRRHLNNN